MPAASSDPVCRAIAARRTAKVLAPDPDRPPFPAETDRALVEAVVAAAGAAPFHHAAPEGKRSGGALEPWRVYVLDAPACRALAQTPLVRSEGGKVPRLLVAATALLHVTWLPEGESAAGRSPRFEPTLKNMEGIAAAGAAVQNALLAATSLGLDTYWGSGGVLAEPEGLALLGVPPGEVLLGSVYLFPPDAAAAPGVDVLAGKHRDARSPASRWARWVGADALGG